MKYFAKALKQAWRHWPALILGLLCSVAVAALWGANIAAIFPIIETTLHGDSLQSWNQKRLDTAQKSLAAHQAQVADLEKKIAATADAAAKREFSLQLDIASSQIKIDKAGMYSAQRLQPYFDRYLPSKPFPTVVLIASV